MQLIEDRNLKRFETYCDAIKAVGWPSKGGGAGHVTRLANMKTSVIFVKKCKSVKIFLIFFNIMHQKKNICYAKRILKEEQGM